MKLIDHLKKNRGTGTLWKKQVLFYLIQSGIIEIAPKKVNLCCGSLKLDDCWNVDIAHSADIIIDLEKRLMPFPDNSMDAVICISAINYFERNRAQEIVNDVFRVLSKNGVARFATQDLRIIASKYANADKDFFFQKLPDGKERFEGITMGDKFNSWFYGYKTHGGKICKYVYDYESLAVLFQNAGFSIIEQKKFLESKIEGIEKIDNRPDQMFFLEAIK